MTFLCVHTYIKCTLHKFVNTTDIIYNIIYNIYCFTLIVFSTLLYIFIYHWQALYIIFIVLTFIAFFHIYIYHCQTLYMIFIVLTFIGFFYIFMYHCRTLHIIQYLLFYPLLSLSHLYTLLHISLSDITYNIIFIVFLIVFFPFIYITVTYYI